MSLKAESEQPAPYPLDSMSSLEIVQAMQAEDRKIAQAVAAALPQVARAVDMIVPALQAGGRLFYIGAGTSGRLGVLDAAECVPTFSVSPELVQGLIAGGIRAMTEAVEGAEDHPAQAARDLRARQFDAGDILCAIAASGTTPYAIGALQYAAGIGAGTIAISCKPGSALEALADVAISVDVGAELIRGSTRLKSGSAQKMILNMLSTASMVQLGKVYGNLMVDVKVSNQKLRERARRLVAQLTGLSPAAADDLLVAANLEVKTAVTMQHLALDAPAARAQLRGVDGRLRSIIGDLPE